MKFGLRNKRKVNPVLVAVVLIVTIVIAKVITINL